ncbi:hypothetical protein GLOTRDRAFT_134149 [Gloeophyllum trabeum ATCC 11539]|uniref:Uncharacterized protein n=1 Tax=Gloeophyllum trabeum (strain ATCC 11539 / FP-39264 / Madison 617) TaxID=670483 RepID=S7PS50_GLOTA|nr:uncharacterized protein GLOTRDRAFT_134149 [Gloeophyllum trabeum ATCC 11539]EPQ50212.1 hypothetical protein GLOTRDRAFT_134149 [Gloeophyllum trabeum ATCC 11539]
MSRIDFDIQIPRDLMMDKGYIAIILTRKEPEDDEYALTDDSTSVGSSSPEEQITVSPTYSAPVRVIRRLPPLPVQSLVSHPSSPTSLPNSSYSNYSAFDRSFQDMHNKYPQGDEFTGKGKGNEK